MIVIGLTGSIGMGKTTTARLFGEEGAAVWDADAAVHDLYGPDGKAVEAVEAAFPGSTGPGGVDRIQLAAALADRADGFEALEGIVHPLVAEHRGAFLERQAEVGTPVAVLDIPLLLETGGDAFVDAVVVATAPEAVQAERVLARPGMTRERFDAIRARQTPDAEKRARADFLVFTDRGLEAARVQVTDILRTQHDAAWRSSRTLSKPDETSQ